MAKQFDNSFDRFAQRPAANFQLMLCVVLAVFLLTGLGISIGSQTWLIAAIFGVSILTVLIFAVFGLSKDRNLQSSNSEKKIDWEAALPEIQRQNLTLEVAELSKILEIETEQISDLQSAYIVAEDLALRQIQQEEQVPLMRHVSVGGVPFDAVFVKQNIVVCAEAAFLVAPELRQERVDSVMRKIALVKRSIEELGAGMHVRLMMILITQLTEEELRRLRSTLGTKRFGSTPVDIDIRLLDFEALQRIYVTDRDNLSERMTDSETPE